MWTTFVTMQEISLYSDDDTNNLNQPTGPDFTTEYDHANHPECITIKRVDLERCICNVIEEAICDGGNITTLARECMLALDKADQCQ